MIHLTYAPDLVEEAVLLAERSASLGDRRTFRRERDRLYELSDEDEREARFRTLHLRWFERFTLHREVEQSIRERSDLVEGVREARVLPALTRREEGADLIDRLEAGTALVRPLLVIRVRPATLLDAEAVRALLRHELTHVADMLDPAFGYRRSLPPSDAGPSADNIVRDRYRVLWDVTIDGRLVRAGLAGDGLRAGRWREFTATFPMLRDRSRDTFDAWFDSVRPTHDALAAFAVAPTGTNSGDGSDAGRCPVCRFPTVVLERDVDRVSAAAQAMIRADRPAWRSEHGLCAQCLDLYEARVGRTSGDPARTTHGDRVPVSCIETETSATVEPGGPDVQDYARCGRGLRLDLQGDHGIGGERGPGR